LVHTFRHSYSILFPCPVSGGYYTLLWHRREKDSCWPGYEKIGKRAKVKSKTTISLHLKVLRKVGLVTTKRRGYKQTNINYPLRASELTEDIIKKLQRKHEYIIEEIIEERRETTKLREAKRELKNKKSIRQKSPSNQTYPHNDEVQLMDSKKEAKASSTYSSNLNNDSKIEKEKESRGGGFKSIGEFLPPALNIAVKSPPQPPTATIPLLSDKILVPKTDPQKKPVEPLTDGFSKIRHVMLKISEDISDMKHKWENVTQALNIFKKIRVDESKYIDTLWSVRGLTLEIINYLDRPGAYFFKVLRDRWNVISLS
jgi:DNA-binding transcriptional ArsR family regulator